MRCTIIDHTDEWDKDVEIGKLEKSDMTTNPRFGINYVYKLKVQDTFVYEHVDENNDYEIAMSADGSRPIEFTEAAVSTALNASDIVYFNLYDTANVTHVLSIVTEQADS